MPEQIGPFYPTKVPSYSEAADIRQAFNLYHYGTTEVPATEAGILPESMAGYIRDTLNAIDNIQEGIATISILGETINLNDTVITGLYQSTTTPTTILNYPTNIAGLLNVSTSGNYTYQTYLSLAAGNTPSELYFRTGTKVQATIVWDTWFAVSKVGHTHSEFYTKSEINAKLVASPSLNTVAIFDASGRLSSSAISSTELGYVSGTTSNIQSQLDNRSLVGHTHPTYWLKTETAKVTVSQSAPLNPSIGDLWFW